jgi:glycosyltransferase involved in cell wall biosynthesis
LDWAKRSFKRNFSFILGKIFRKPLKKFDFYCVKNADFYFIECKSVQRLLHGIKGQVLYPTVNPKFKITNSKIDELKKFGINKPFILGSGRIVPQKRFDFLVKAFSKLKNKKKLQLVLVGKYNKKTKKNLEKLAYSKGIEVLILGPVNIQDLIKLYNLAKVTVLTCPKEWFGIVPIEAMACGCPVVAWKDNFGPEETVIPGLNGYLAKPYDIDDLSKKIEKILNKNWVKNKIANSVDKFSEKEQGKILLESLKIHFSFL